MIRPTGSTAPPFTFPTWRQAIVGPSTAEAAAAKASGSTRPAASAGTTAAVAAPRPIARSAASIESCRSAPTSTCTCGAPCRPWASTSQPWAARTWLRAAARHAVLAIWPPVTNPTDAARGRSSSSSIQPAATCSIIVVAGNGSDIAQFWSQALTSQSAATATGSAPPITHPRKRPEPLAMRPGSARATRSRTTSAGSAPASGSGAANASSIARAPASGRTGRSGSAASQRRAAAAAISSGSGPSAMARSTLRRRCVSGST